MKKYSILFALLFAVSSMFAQIIDGRTSDFEDGTLQGWRNGANTTTPPNLEETGGPDGEGDAYLEELSDGNGSGGSLVILNTEPEWTGDYDAAGIQFITFYSRTTSDEPLTLRVGIQGGDNDTRLASTTSVDIPITNATWVQYEIDISPENLEVISGTDAISDVLSDVNQIRILHNPDISYTGVSLISLVDFDDITASASALSANSSGFSSPSIYPNPTAQYLNVPAILDSFTYKIYTVTGQKVLEGSKQRGNTLDVSSLPSGIYVLKLLSEANSYHLRFIKE